MCAQHAWLKAQGASLDRPLDSVVLSRIKKLSAMNKLKKAALVVMAQSLSEDEINGLQQLFRSIDADGNGTITVDELRTALSSLNGRLQVPRPDPPSSAPQRAFNEQINGIPFAMRTRLYMMQSNRGLQVPHPDPPSSAPQREMNYMNIYEWHIFCRKDRASYCPLNAEQQEALSIVVVMTAP